MRDIRYRSRQRIRCVIGMDESAEVIVFKLHLIFPCYNIMSEKPRPIVNRECNRETNMSPNEQVSQCTYKFRLRRQ
jgi:hypothetical protein